MSIKLPVQSALVAMAPECGRVIESFRGRHDPSAADGLPAHITLLFPFRPPNTVDKTVVQGLEELFESFSAIHYRLADFRRFPGVLYLAPEPDEPFRKLTLAIWERNPQFPPYAGKHPDIVPHLTVAQSPDERELDQIEEELMRASKQVLPIAASIQEVTLIDTLMGRWRVRHTFRFGLRSCGEHGGIWYSHEESDNHHEEEEERLGKRKRRRLSL